MNPLLLTQGTLSLAKGLDGAWEGYLEARADGEGILPHTSARVAFSSGQGGLYASYSLHVSLATAPVTFAVGLELDGRPCQGTPIIASGVGEMAVHIGELINFPATDGRLTYTRCVGNGTEWEARLANVALAIGGGLQISDGELVWSRHSDGNWSGVLAAKAAFDFFPFVSFTSSASIELSSGVGVTAISLVMVRITICCTCY